MNVNKQVSYFSKLLKDHLELHKTVLENDITMLLNGTAIDWFLQLRQIASEKVDLTKGAYFQYP